MVYASKELRNESLVQKRIKDPKKWTWGELGKHFEVHRSVAKQIFVRDIEKYANEYQIEAYEKKIKQIQKKNNFLDREERGEKNLKLGTKFNLII